MANYEDAPRNTMVRDAKAFAGISVRELVSTLESSRCAGTPYSVLNKGDSEISRAFTHRGPEDRSLDGNWGDFSLSIPSLTEKIRAGVRKKNKKLSDAEARAIVAEHYRGEAAQAMAAACSAYGLDERLYLNAVAGVETTRVSREEDKTMLYVLLFVATGLYGDPARAVEAADAFTKRLGGDYGVTMDATRRQPVSPAAQDFEQPLALQRIFVDADGGQSVGNKYTLDPEGTVVGKLATNKSDIKDVGEHVSREHLSIWREDGTWYAMGHQTTNGTELIPGDGSERKVIEPPRRAREQGVEYGPVAIGVNDMLVLGTDTYFLVVKPAR